MKQQGHAADGGRAHEGGTSQRHTPGAPTGTGRTCRDNKILDRSESYSVRLHVLQATNHAVDLLHTQHNFPGSVMREW